ncbi:hypothetical protein [Rubripirellula obstinata]|uniref:hypothetical protein n=1 Tax=Rubripirellula obstinata TaxID=406547 RepID=UPI00122CC952|nr:hypothetical protein [Rubripirellula obstinata]
MNLNRTKSPSVITTWQTLRSNSRVCTLLLITFFAFQSTANAQLHDSLDAYPPRFFLGASDCDARVIQHDSSVTGGVNGGACEMVTMVATSGTEAHLVYPIEPVRPIDDLNAVIQVMSANEGATIGFRVRYPFLRDPETRRPVSVIVFGASYASPGEFASIGIGAIQRPLQLKQMSLRSQYGPESDLQDPYVDAVVINAYGGPGTTAIRMDELRVEGMIPVSAGVITGNRHSNESSNERSGDETRYRLQPGSSSIENDRDLESVTNSLAFPVGRVTRILQHSGEPLAWVRTLGFDAVLLRKSPDAAILSEAIRTRMKIYAPPPQSPDPTLAAMLEPVAGWYIGSGEALDERQLDTATETIARLKALPTRWQRPIVAAPSDSYLRYASMVDAIIDDLPPPARSLRGSEESAQLTQRRTLMADRAQVASGVASMPPESMLVQAEQIADAIGAPRPSNYRWQAMWLQTMRSLQQAPAAILYRSTRSLASGSEMDQARAMSMSFTNRMVAMIEPWIVASTPSAPPTVQGAAYQCSQQTTGSTDLLVLTSDATRGSEVLAGDGQSLRIKLGPSETNKTAWRLTHFSAERLTPRTNSLGGEIEIVSPDAVEIIVLSSDPAVGSQLVRQSSRYAKQASLDRWQLAAASVMQARSGWDQAIAMRAVGDASPTNLIAVAEQTLSRAEPAYRAGDTDTTIRMACRADAWAMRSSWQLAEALMPHWPMPTSSPPIDFGATEIQSLWRPLMNDEGWGENLLTAGSLDSAELVGPGRWTFGRRLESRAHSEVGHINRGSFAGPGALRARVTALGSQTSADSLGGGYAGTVVQIRSPSIRLPAGSAIRIDAMVRTVGFGGPHQGVLVYDGIGGQPMGVLVRGRSDWTPVRLYRQTVADGPVSVMFELLGAGEAMIDEVTLRVWQPKPDSGIQFRPIAPDTVEIGFGNVYNQADLSNSSPTSLSSDAANQNLQRR